VTQDAQWITVQEAAHSLGVKEDAIRKRIQRGTLRHRKDLKDGRVYVQLDVAREPSQDIPYTATYASTQDGTQDTTEDASHSALTETLQDQVEYLRGVIDTRDRELEARTEELRRKDHIIAALTERIPELEPAREAPPEPPESPLSDSEDRGKGDYPRSRRTPQSAARGSIGSSSGRQR
jgi:excisionase family DNA binding protein